MVHAASPHPVCNVVWLDTFPLFSEDLGGVSKHCINDIAVKKALQQKKKKEKSSSCTYICQQALNLLGKLNSNSWLSLSMTLHCYS